MLLLVTLCFTGTNHGLNRRTEIRRNGTGFKIIRKLGREQEMLRRNSMKKATGADLESAIGVLEDTVVVKELRRQPELTVIQILGHSRGEREGKEAAAEKIGVRDLEFELKAFAAS